MLETAETEQRQYGDRTEIVIETLQRQCRDRAQTKYDV